jgi:hypothetical protein
MHPGEFVIFSVINAGALVSTVALGVHLLNKHRKHVVHMIHKHVEHVKACLDEADENTELIDERTRKQLLSMSVSIATLNRRISPKSSGTYSIGSKQDWNDGTNCLTLQRFDGASTQQVPASEELLLRSASKKGTKK